MARRKRNKAKSLVGRLRGVHWLNWAAGILSAFVMPFLYQAMTEFVRIRSITSFLSYVEARFGQMLLGYWVLLGLAICITCITARPWVSNFVLGGLLFAMAYGNYYKLVYRGDPMVPKDIFQVSEALHIGTEIGAAPTREIWLFLALWLLSTFLLLPFLLPFNRSWKSLVARITLPAVVAASTLLYVFAYLGNKTLMGDRHGIIPRASSLADTYYTSSFVTGFLYFAANAGQKAPAGYSSKAMDSLAAELPASSGRRADVIIVMLESFYDITKAEGVSFSEPVLPNYQRLAEEGITGSMLGDKRGGGTSDFEFAMLTGFSTSFLATGSVPYIEYTYPEFPSLPWFYKSAGYRNAAIHPYQPSFYNRTTVYKDMGFEHFITEDEFDSTDVLGSYISDDALAHRIILEYEQLSAEGENVFIHAVSMQNHSPYDPGVYPDGHAVNAAAEGFDNTFNQSFSTLATGIRDTDALMGTLTDYFRTVDRDVALLFFGDHQTSVLLEGESAEDFMEAGSIYQNASDTEKFAITHTTPYLFWANYALQPGQGGRLTADRLGAAFLQTCDVLRPAWFSWLAEQSGSLGGSTAGYYVNPDNTLVMQPTLEQASLLGKQEMFQYDLLFGRKKALDAMYSLPEEP